MANYIELSGLANDSALIARVSVALTVVATALIEDPLSDASQRNWAQGVLYEPVREGKKALRYVLVKNKDFTVAQIQNSTEEALQTRVDEVVPYLVQAFAKQ